MHTPGPWTVKANDHTLVGPPGLVVAQVAGAHRENTDANARLIAASPAMLEALRAAQDGKGDWRALVDEAIAQATT